MFCVVQLIEGKNKKNDDQPRIRGESDNEDIPKLVGAGHCVVVERASRCEIPWHCVIRENRDRVGVLERETRERERARGVCETQGRETKEQRNTIASNGKIWSDSKKKPTLRYLQ